MLKIGKLKTKLLTSSVILYPFIPLIKEWTPVLGMITELLIIGELTLVLLFKKKHMTIPKTMAALILITIYILWSIYSKHDLLSAFSAFRSLYVYIAFYECFIDEYGHVNSEIVSSTKALLIVQLIFAIGCLIQFVYPPIIKRMHSPTAYAILRTKTNWVAFHIYNRALSFMTDPNILAVFLTIGLILLKKPI